MWGGEGNMATCRLPQKGPHKKAMWAISLSLAPTPCNSVFPHMSLEPPEPLNLCWSPGILRVNLRVGLLTGWLGFQVPSVSPRQPKSLLVFTVRFYGNSSFWVRNPGQRRLYAALGPLAPSGGPLQLYSPSLCSTTMRGCRASHFASSPLL